MICYGIVSKKVEDRNDLQGLTRRFFGYVLDISLVIFCKIYNVMKKINIQKELKEWLINYLTYTIHNLEAENFDEFIEWAKSFKREEAEFVVNMEFVNDWGYDNRTEIAESEAVAYGEILLKKILDRWYL